MSERVKITDIQNESTDNNTAAGDTTSPNTSDDMMVFVAAVLLVAIMGAAKAFKKCKRGKIDVQDLVHRTYYN